MAPEASYETASARPKFDSAAGISASTWHQRDHPTQDLDSFSRVRDVAALLETIPQSDTKIGQFTHGCDVADLLDRTGRP